MLKIYNTLSRDKREFIPITPDAVRMYVCGMTVYDYCHLGHARVLVVFDMAYRWLKASGFDVTYVRNITDIDDKIIRRAAENKESIHALTQRFIAAMHEDADALGVQRPDHEPCATQYVPQMLEMIEKLEENGLAYRAADGDVNYAVRKFPGYGNLSGKSLEDLRAGERVDVTDGKNDPLDFVLWKHARDSESDEVKWDSPWGKGRPGWHIECSAMGSEILGKHFDIHGGGADLQFPHHENEIAQSEGAHKCRFVNYWMHNGFVRVDEEKMSKSLGNFFTIREVLKKYDAEVVRFFILRAHYRSPLNYSDMHLDDAKGALTRLYTALKFLPVRPEPSTTLRTKGLVEGERGDASAHATSTNSRQASTGSARTDLMDWNEPHARRFKAAMDDDFNTPEAVAVLFDLANEVNRTQSAEAASQLKALAGVLGLLQRDPQAFLQGGAGEGGFDDTVISAQIEARITAKKSKNFAEADRIRKELLETGIVLEDSAMGTTWRRV
ncbi:MAG: cysteine--tRNA ligase [Nitrosomonadales bacterium]|nr:cysteine--tRNA ligase [Nitrosomonadales bacterium]